MSTTTIDTRRRRRIRLSDGELRGVERKLRVVADHARRRQEVYEAADLRRDAVIREALAAGMTQQAVADVTGLSRQRVAQLAGT